MRMPRYLQVLVVLALLAATVSLSAFLQGRMNTLRQEAKLTDDTPLLNAPPVVAFATVALGAFRGLLADFLYLRSNHMQEQGNYFELVQLASWLVKLQPRFTGATAFLAWNMAYNISVTFNEPRDRWRWVQRGIELIRDEALIYNPDDPKLYKELGWLYQHKLGQLMDDANFYYKGQMARQVMTVLGRQDPIPWERYAAAPLTPEELDLALGPAAADSLKALLEAKGSTLARLELEFRERGAWPVSLVVELQAWPGLSLLEDYLRSRWARSELKLEARFIAPLTTRLGYLDFRLPEAHAVYWASVGLTHAPDGKDLDCERMVFQSMMNAFKFGKLLYLSDYGLPFIGPNLAVADSVKAQYLQSMVNHPDNMGVRAGYENFMKDAIVIFYTSGRQERAGEYLKELRGEFPGHREYSKNLDTFALEQLAEDIADKSTKQVMSILVEMLFQSCVATAIGDPEKAKTYELLARRVHGIYQSDLDGKRIQMRKGLPPFAEIQREVLDNYCLSSLPPDLGNLLRAELGLPPATPPPAPGSQPPGAPPPRVGPLATPPPGPPGAPPPGGLSGVPTAPPQPRRVGPLREPTP